MRQVTGAKATPETATGSTDGDAAAEQEAERIRAAYVRRGPVEARLAVNAGQAAIVRERNERIMSLVEARGRHLGALLDLGCGDGATIGALSRRIEIDRPVGLDLLPERIARARAAWPGIDFRVADGSRLPFPDDTFDVVLAMTLLSSVPLSARAPIMAEVGRVLRPGGAFIWYDMRRPSPSNADVRPFSVIDAQAFLSGWRIRARPLTVAPPIARHLGSATRRLYPWLARIPILLSHEVGIAIKPSSTSPETDA